MMRLHFRCGSCGRKGCEFETPRRGTGQNGANIGDDEQYPHGKELQRGYGEAVWPETRAEADNRVLKAYRARYAGGDAIRTVGHICNLYSMTKGPQAIRDLLKVMQKYDFTGNMEQLYAVRAYETELGF